jgi:hypothetical protein
MPTNVKDLMITNVLAIAAALGVVASLGVMLYGWFTVSFDRFQGVTAKDVLARWDAELAQMSDDDRERERRLPPVEVLNALIDLPSPRRRLVELS